MPAGPPCALPGGPPTGPEPAPDGRIRLVGRPGAGRLSAARRDRLRERSGASDRGEGRPVPVGNLRPCARPPHRSHRPLPEHRRNRARRRAGWRGRRPDGDG
ncbi:hypothetical protein DMP14_08205 [Pseudonocardia sp. Ae707_Ps2]